MEDIQLYGKASKKITNFLNTTSPIEGKWFFIEAVNNNHKLSINNLYRIRGEEIYFKLIDIDTRFDYLCKFEIYGKLKIQTVDRKAEAKLAVPLYYIDMATYRENRINQILL